LVPVVEADGSRWVTQAELARCQAARVAGVDPKEIRAWGDESDQLSIGEATRLAGLTNRYMRKVAKHHEDHRTDIERTIEAGRQPRKAYLAARRGTRGQWLVPASTTCGERRPRCS